MIKNIVLDMGNVCCLWDVNYIAGCLSDNEDDRLFIVKNVFQSLQWKYLDEGVITVEQAQEQISQNKDERQKKLIRKALVHWYDYFEQFNDMEQLIVELKNQGYKIYLLSNCSMQFYDYYTKKSIFSHFDGYYISAKYQLLKPSKTIYKSFLQTFDLNADECIFIDDMFENVEAAQSVGIKGIVYDGDLEGLKEKIHKICQ